MAYCIAPVSRLVLVRGSGVVYETEVALLRWVLRRDPLFVPTFRELIDRRAVTDIAMSPSALQTVAASNPYDQGALRAVVAPERAHLQPGAHLVRRAPSIRG